MTAGRASRSTRTPVDERLALSPAEVARALGVGINQAASLINTGELPSFLIGDRRRVSRAVLEEWMARKTRETSADELAARRTS